jgi:hypothetical protein
MRQIVILQTPNGYFVFPAERLDLEKPPELNFHNAIPAVSLTKSYGEPLGKSVLEITEEFFRKPPAETT